MLRSRASTNVGRRGSRGRRARENPFDPEGKSLDRPGGTGGVIQERAASALYTEARNGEPENIRLLIDSGANVNRVEPHNNATALCAAAANQHPKALSALLNAGGDANLGLSNGVSPALLAAWHGGSKGGKAGGEVMRLLIKGSAQVNRARRRDGTAPVHIAALKGNNTSLKMMLGAGADPNKTRRDACGNTPLLLAARRGHAPTVRTLIKAGASVSAVDVKGRSALFLASMGGHADVVKALLDAGASVDGDALTTSTKASALHAAACNGHRDALAWLLKAGADIDRRDEASGGSPIYAAVQNEHAPVVAVLARAGADVNAQQRGGFSPLYLAVQRGNHIMAEILLKWGGLPGLARADGWTPVHAAAARGDLNMLTMMLNGTKQEKVKRVALDVTAARNLDSSPPRLQRPAYPHATSAMKRASCLGPQALVRARAANGQTPVSIAEKAARESLSASRRAQYLRAAKLLAMFSAKGATTSGQRRR